MSRAPGDATTERVDVAQVSATLGHLLHRAGVPTAPDRSARFATAMQVALPATIDELYWAARITLVGEQAHLATFDRVFRQVFHGLVDPADFRGASEAPPPAHTTPGESLPRRSDAPPAAAGGVPHPMTGEASGSAEQEGEPTVLAAMSSEERLHDKDFAALSPDELAQVRGLMSRLALVAPERPSRRTVAHQRGDAVDLRATFRRAHRTAGDPLEVVVRKKRSRPRRLVFLCDISGSMEPYSRAYLQLLHSAVGGAKAEAFVFATRLSRVTRALRTTNPDLALRRAALAAPDWSGGTRIGAALKAFNDEHGRRGLVRGAVVVIVSDGWERDDPALLGREMERLHRLAHRIIWVNPRVASARFAPLAGGMAAALPFVDALVSGHSLDALDELLAAIAA
ncbi:MAG: VWA domain-containing protein [Acidimicrobiia bacterium]